MDQPPSKIGERIRVLREEAGLSQDELGRVARYKSPGHFSKIERGLVKAPETWRLQLIAEKLGTTVEYLASDKPAPQERAAEPEAKEAPNAPYSQAPEDPLLLSELVAAAKRYRLPVTDAELAWLRLMPPACTLDELQTALGIYRDGASRCVLDFVEPATLAAPRAPAMPDTIDFETVAVSGTQTKQPAERPAAAPKRHKS